MKKYVIWRKVTLFWDIWEVKISLSGWSNWIWSHSSSLTFCWLIPQLQSHLTSSGNDIEVLLWTVTVSSITFIVSEGKFDRLINKLTTVTNYTRPTRFILRVLDCQKLYRSIVWLSVICIVYNWQQKVQFSRIYGVVTAIVLNIASVKLHLKYYKFIHIVW